MISARSTGLSVTTQMSSGSPSPRPLVGLLASIYDSIAEHGRKLRDSE